MDSGNTEAWDSREAVLRVIERTEALKALYRGLGYSPALERQAQGLVAELASGLRAEIPHPAAFRRAVTEIRRQFEAYRRGETTLDPLWMADSDLFDAVFEARDDLQGVIALLNEDPLWKTLPYEIESSLLRRRPVDLGRFANRLDELERLFTVPWAPLPNSAR